MNEYGVEKLRQQRREGRRNRYLQRQGGDEVVTPVEVPVQAEMRVEPAISSRPPQPEYTKDNWVTGARCANDPDTDPELFYAANPESVSIAKRMCGSCAVRVFCLEYAITRGENYGVWGGMTESERRAVLRHRLGRGIRTRSTE